MIQFNLLELSQKQFPNLDLEKEEDIIKVEKILKAEAKLNPSVKINDIENLTVFLKNYKGRFIPILKNKNVKVIIEGKGDAINFARFDQTNITEETLVEFQQAFSENILSYLKHCIRNSKWNFIKSIFINYTFLIDALIKEEVCKSFKLKNQSVLSAIIHHQYIAFAQANSYATDIQYYSLLSTIDKHFFDDDIFAINNSISSVQNTNDKNKAYLGKILHAATYFEAYNESLKTTLENNRGVALEWVYPNLRENKTNYSNTTTLVIIGATLLGLVAFAFLLPSGVSITPFIIVVGIIIRIIRLVKKD